MLLGISADEIEADKSLSGGNLSASSRGLATANAVVATTTSPDEEVMKKIYDTNQCTTTVATYKLEVGNPSAVDVLDQE